MYGALKVNPSLKNNYINKKPNKTVAFGRDFGSEIFKEIKKEVESNGQIKTKVIVKKLKGPFGFSSKKITDFVETINDRTTSMLIQIQGLRKALKEDSVIIERFPREKEEAVEEAKKTTVEYYTKIIAQKDKEILEAKAQKQSPNEFSEKNKH
jgi:RNA-binding protein YhbY